jgi:hypothetical protein
MSKKFEVEMQHRGMKKCLAPLPIDCRNKDTLGYCTVYIKCRYQREEVE